MTNMSKKILLASPHMSDEGYEQQFIKEAFDTNWIAPLGKNVNKFEEEIATILASKYEAFGLVGPESISCGTPVLFSDTIGAAEVLSEPGCYCFKRSVEDLRELLDRMGERFRTGTLRVESPAKCIHYPYRFDEYLDELISLIQS